MMRPSIREYVADHEITLEILSGADFAVDSDDWPHHVWSLRLTNPSTEQTMDVTWKTGIGITDDPEPADVLDNMIGGTTSFLEARSFEEWARDYGYDEDSRAAHALWKALGKDAGKLVRFLGSRGEVFHVAEAYEGL